MSSSRVHCSFTGTPARCEIAAASHMKSLYSRRPKPPPIRVWWSRILDLSMPIVRATASMPLPGVCVGAQISMAPSANEAVQFCGSSWAWLTKWYV